MCHHKYTLHLCRHKSVLVEKCDQETLATMAPFCDRYHVQKESSIWLCGGSYCRQDKETANWIENGLALLEACDDDLRDFKNRLTNLHQELERIREHRDAWDSLLEGFTEHAQSKDQEYAELRRAHGETKTRRLLIIGGIKTARQKQEATKQRVIAMCKQAQAIKAAKMRRVEQYVEGQALQPPLFASPQAAPETDNACPRRTLTRADSGLWEGGDVSGTPCRTNTNTISPVKPKPNKAFQAQMSYSPPTLAPAFSFTTQKPNIDLNSSPPKKRRGRPPKVKPDESASGHSYQRSSIPINTTGTSTTEYEARKREATKSAKADILLAQKLPSSGTRRSGRLKQRISYAESPTSSPERPVQEQPEDGPETAVVNESGRSTRVARAQSSKKKVHEEDVYSPDEEDQGNDARGDWQGDEDVVGDDLITDDSSAQQARWSTKRTATSPPKDPRLLKRQNTAGYQDAMHGDFHHYGERNPEETNGRYGVPGLGNGWSYMEKSTNQPISGTAWNWPDKQPFSATPEILSHNAHRSHVSPEVDHNSRYSTPPYGNTGNGKMSTSHYQTSLLAHESVIDPIITGGQEYNGHDMSPMRRSDMLNGLGGGGGDMLLPVDDLNDANYDFDVSAMSKVVADLDAQQN